MVWFMILLLLFVFVLGALGQTITFIKSEPSFQCSREFLVADQDYTVIEYEVSGSNSTYPLEDGLFGPQFYYSSTTSNNYFSPCSGFDILTNACTDRSGESNACSCLEVTSGSVYRLTYNMTADLTLSKQSVWLVWPGPPEFSSDKYTLLEVRDGCLDASAHEESIVNKEDSLNISSIVIGVIAVVIIAVLIVVIIFLLKKIRGLKKERLDSQYKVPLESKPQSHQNDDYLVPFEMPTITTPVSASLPPRPRQYKTVDNIPAITDTTPVSTSLPPRPEQYETVDNIPTTTDTTPVSARLPPRPVQYETVDDIPTTTDTTPVSASLPPRPGQYETVDDIPTTTDTTNVSTSKLPIPRNYGTSDDITSATPASAKFTRGTAQYETIQDMATTSGTYNSTSRQDVDPLNVYQDLEPNHLTSGDLGSSGPYHNVSGQHEEKLRNPAINYANVDMSCL